MQRFSAENDAEGKTERSLKFFRYAGDEKVVQATVSLGAALYIINVYRSRDEKKEDPYPEIQNNKKNKDILQ